MRPATFAAGPAARTPHRAGAAVVTYDREWQASEAKARLLFENAAQGITITDRDGRIVEANPTACRLFGYSSAELIGESIDILLPESFRGRHAGLRADYDRQPHARPMGIGMDLVGRRKDGSEFPVEISLSHAAEYGGLTMAFISDIAARRNAALEREGLTARLEGALEEKTVLLKEINHRVKNNLAVIGALLGMQADEIDDERARVAFCESRQRVVSMALIHEFLYADEHLDRVNFGKYVRQLVSHIRESCAIGPDRVRLSIDAAEINLPVDRAIPCGLILNELLSNAYKHAFPGGRGGNIGVRFARLDSGRLSLSCQDDGAGIPETFDWRNAKSLGLRIVQILSKQIDGAITLHRGEEGTRFELIFPPHNP
jgi:PAS domain S-box-containing protein